MRRGSDHDRARTRLRLGIALFTLALSAPSLLLVHKAYDQMKWESFRQQQIQAEALAGRIDSALAELIRAEDARAIQDYDFLVSSGDSAHPYPRRSPLSDPTVSQTIPGLMGWFQVATDGSFSSPLVPDSTTSPTAHGITPADLALRQAQAQRIQGILIGNRLVERGAYAIDQVTSAPEPAKTPPAATGRTTDARLETLAKKDAVAVSSPPPGSSEPVQPAKQETSSRLSQAAFERLATKEKDTMPQRAQDESKALARVEDLRLDLELSQRGQRQRQPAPAPNAEEEQPTRAAEALPPTLSAAYSSAARPVPDKRPRARRSEREPRAKPVQLFESTVEPFEVGLLDSGHLLLFRDVWRDGARIIQGALIEQEPFLKRLIGAPLASTMLARTTHLIIAYRGAVLATFRAESADDDRSHAASLTHTPPPLTGALLFRTRMREPFGGLELIFTVSRLPTPPGAAVIGWMAAALALVLLAGGWLMYRLGLSQLALVRQQQDFVSAVSHELKTPLTSIRMYAEMLRAGFAPEERKATYYRFIHEESERLSRLIANVLQLARIGRDTLVLEPRAIEMRELMGLVRERIASQVERAGFALEIDCSGNAAILVDPDAFVQILINLVDNALKFTAQAKVRRIRIRCETVAGGRLRVSVRDFGPGIAREQRKRIFQLFYRGTEAKRQAISGTGIGLALVQRLTRAMGGRVEVVSAEPGAEFRIELSTAGTADCAAPARTDSPNDIPD